MGGGKRRPIKFTGGGHLSAGDLPAKSRTEPRGPHSKGTAIGYAYSSRPIQFATSSVVAFVDPTPSSATTAAGVPAYDYDPAIVGGLGLGFQNEEEEEEQSESEGRGEGFLSIGGVRVYTEDCSSPDDDDDASDSGDSIGSDSSKDEEDRESSDESSSDDEDDDDSEINDEMVEDYIEGIDGSSEVLNSEWLAKSNVEEATLRSESSSDDKVDLMKVSKEYGMLKKKKKKKATLRKGRGDVSSPLVEIGLSAAMDDLMLAKDPRTASGRNNKKKKKALSQLSTSWPREAKRSKEYHSVAGGKKKQHKEQIAVKRRLRMINRGVDLDQINLKLKQMVINKVDMLSFHPMHSRDCSQVQRIASIYHLQSGRQGSGKKRFVTVTRTTQTCLPSPYDKLRLEKLLRAGVEEDFIVNNEKSNRSHSQPRSRPKSDKRLLLNQSAPPKFTKNGESSGKKKQAEKTKSDPYSKRPVSFISSGVMQVDLEPDQSITTDKTIAASSSEVGAFEMHTKGFGSKMMAKMGFVEGSGLGKDGQGMVCPIEAIQRPKSLGLGVQFDEAMVESAKTSSGSNSGAFVKHDKGSGSKMVAKMGSGNDIGAFEKHTTGFGSKMMARMGFVEGRGLGKDAQGIVTPLSAVRRPKCRGLGAKS